MFVTWRTGAITLFKGKRLEKPTSCIKGIESFGLFEVYGSLPTSIPRLFFLTDFNLFLSPLRPI